ncbi:MAG: acyltransferase [Bacteroidales bacterium]|nr:acyltransferase [Bacteroidales bacterium]
MEENKILHGLDIYKWVCALLIVFLHTYNRDWGVAGHWFWSVITSIGVPFFFIVSGFFYGKGLVRSEFSREYFMKYFKRLVIMYVAWSIITLPVSWLCVLRGHPDYSLPLKVVYLFRMFFFSGSCGIYWYILALICCSIVIFHFMKRGRGNALYVMAVLLFGVGVWYDSPYNNHNLVFQFIHAVFGSERNFFNVGLFYMCIGYFFASHEKIHKTRSIHLYALLTISIVLRTIEVNLLHTNLLQALIAIVLFLLAWNTELNISDEQSLRIRKLSTAMYLLHYPFILLFDFYLRRGTIIDYPVALCFCLIVFYVIINYFPVKWQRALLG